MLPGLGWSPMAHESSFAWRPNSLYFLQKTKKFTHNILWLRDKCKQSRIVHILFITKFHFFLRKTVAKSSAERFHGWKLNSLPRRLTKQVLREAPPAQRLRRQGVLPQSPD